jgi:chromosome segregation ATPase
MSEAHAAQLQSEHAKISSQAAEIESHIAAQKRLKEKLIKRRNQKSVLRQKLELTKTENEAQKRRIEELETRVRDFEIQNSVMLGKISNLQQNMGESEKYRRLAASLSEELEKLKREAFELRQKDRETSEFQNTIKEKDVVIARLKTQIQDLMKTAQEQVERIGGLQNEICERDQKVAVFSSDECGIMGGLAKMEEEKEALEKKLRESEASEELVKRNRKLSEMIEASNLLYVKLKEENEALKKRMRKSPTCRLESCNVVSILDGVTMKVVIGRRSCEESARNEYLRRVLLQFFTEEEGSRMALIPIILKLVNCRNEQISAAVRQWKRTSRWMLGIFG